MTDVHASLARWVSDHPGASAVFLRYRLDFCCGGQQPLDEACRDSGLDCAQVVAEVRAGDAESTSAPVNWELRTPAELVDHILRTYHEPLRRDLPALVESARKVERVHADKGTCPSGLADHLSRVSAALDEHMRLEETGLFSALTGGEKSPDIEAAIRTLMREHDEHGENLRRVRELTADLKAPPEACATWRATYDGLEQLEADLMAHVHLENNVLFPRVLAELSKGQRDEA